MVKLAEKEDVLPFDSTVLAELDVFGELVDVLVEEVLPELAECKGCCKVLLVEDK